MVKSGTVSTPFKFVFFDDNSIKQSIPCTGTSGFTFVRLINGHLFLKKTGLPDVYHVCQFSTVAVANSVKSLGTKTIFTPTTITNAVVSFVPYSVRETV